MIDGVDMSNKILDLISEYQHAVIKTLILMQKSGIKMPRNRFEWINYKIPSHGKLKGDLDYSKHGAGCKVYYVNEVVDFDFGVNGEIDEFDFYKIWLFSSGNLKKFGIKDDSELIHLFDLEVNSREIAHSCDGWYYLAHKKRLYAIDVDVREPNDSLPMRHNDLVLLLYWDYFYAAELMCRNYKGISHKTDSLLDLENNDRLECKIYFSSWLGYLYVTCEAFKKLKLRVLLLNERPLDFIELVPKADEIGKLINRHSDALRKYRNGVFHLRDNLDSLTEFFSVKENRIEWADELQSTLLSFFKEYRMKCELHYIINHRLSESSLHENNC